MCCLAVEWKYDQATVVAFPALSEELDDVRAKLAARRAACLDRLEDAVSELITLHGLDAADIRACVEDVIAAEEREASL